MSAFPLKRLGRLGLVITMLVAASDATPDEARGPATPFDPQKARFSVKFREEVSPYRVLGVFVLPEEALRLEVVDAAKGKEYALEASSGEVTRIASHEWLWRAPKATGLYPVAIIDPQSPDSTTLNVFVMVPYSQLTGEYLNGYRIGKYPSIPLKLLPIYEPPRGFVEVTAENEETLVAPHFRLKQFLCRQVGDYPKYLVLRERLLLALELILERANEKGYRCDTLGVLSGYRTPYRNKAIGNARYSRHLWGDAADIFLDQRPEEGTMHDPGHDGKTGRRVAAVLYDIVDGLYDKPFCSWLVGGLGVYPAAVSRGPFVHVDVRGLRVRWGRR